MMIFSVVQKGTAEGEGQEREQYDGDNGADQGGGQEGTKEERKGDERGKETSE